MSTLACPICGNKKLVIADTPAAPAATATKTASSPKKGKSKTTIAAALFLIAIIAIALMIYFCVSTGTDSGIGVPTQADSGIVTPKKCNSYAHYWIYNTVEQTKECTVCGEQQDYSPSGYYLNAIQIEVDSAKPFFNDTQILCTYSESTYEQFNRSKNESAAQSLIEENKAFYAKPNVTCDILSDTNMLAPQRHIVITSGEYNGVNCWTAMAVVVNDDDVELYKKWLDDPSNPANRDDSWQPASTPAPSKGSDDGFVGILEGMYLVGTDIPAGTYRLVPLFDEYPGYWERLSNASGETSAIIANDLFNAPTYVTVNSGEYFEIERCTGALQ